MSFVKPDVKFPCLSSLYLPNPCFVCIIGDDIKSVVSDTWSTDVIASDSEPPEQNQLERLVEVVEEPAANMLGVHEVHRL